MSTPKPTLFASGATWERRQKALGAGVGVGVGVGAGVGEGEASKAAAGVEHWSRRINAPSPKYVVPLPAYAKPLAYCETAVASPSCGAPLATAPFPATVATKPPAMEATLREKALEKSHAPVSGA